MKEREKKRKRGERKDIQMDKWKGERVSSWLHTRDLNKTKSQIYCQPVS